MDDCKVHTARYASPIGGLLLAADGQGLTGLWLDGEKYFAKGLPQTHEAGDTPALQAAVRWLDLYFDGRRPQFTPPLHPIGTPFQMKVWRILLEIPYGKTTTYGAIAARIAREEGKARMSAQAVGGAVGHNPISVIVPCHRVLGADGSLTGYAGGIDKKRYLLALEGVKSSLW